MNRGYIRLWRKALDDGWLQNPPLWSFWTWVLLKATHRTIAVRVGFQQVTLQPGQLIFGRQMAARELRLSEKTIRSCLEFLKKSGSLTIASTNKFSILTIVNWGLYQADCSDSDQENEHPLTGHQPKSRKKKNPEDISSEISILTNQLFPSTEGRELFAKTIEALSSTRRTNKLSSSAILNLLHAFQKYQLDQVITGMTIFIEKGCAHEGKDEAYLKGIIRRQRITSTRQEFKPTGSPLLDALNRGEIVFEEPRA
jgi:hypothetical protein